MKPDLIFDIEEDVVSYMNRMMFEANSRRDVVDFFLNDHIQDVNAEAINSPIFKEYEKRYVDACIAYDQAKNDFFENHVPKEVKDTYDNYTWNLNFATRKLEIFINNQTGCSCGSCRH